MYYINKIVGVVTGPFSVAILGGALAVLLAYRGEKCRRIGKWLGILSVTWLWFWMTPLAGRIVGASLEREFLVDGLVPAVESFPKADAIVLLGGGMGIETNLSPYAEMWTSADRVWQAARLWKAKRAPRIIATSGRVMLSTGGLLADFGISKEAMVFLTDARNTEEEARTIARMLEKETHPRILLVTSAWHMKRARFMFEKYAPSVEVVPAPSDFEFSYLAAQRFTIADLFPDANMAIGNTAALHELVGLFGYWAFR